MGPKSTKPITTVEFHRVQAELQLVRKDDKEALRAIFKLFANSSSQDERFQVSKSLFSSTFHITGPLCDRLFSIFDSRRAGKLDYNDFVRGLSLLLGATLKDKVALLCTISGSKPKCLSKHDFSFLLKGLAQCYNCTVSFLLSGMQEANKSSSEESRVIERAFTDCLGGVSGKEVSLDSFEKWVISCPPLRWFIEMEFLGKLSLFRDKLNNVCLVFCYTHLY